MPSRSRPSGRRRTLLFLLFAVALVAAAGIWLTTATEDDDVVRAGNDAPAAAPTTSPPVTDSEELASLGPDRTGGAPVPTEPSTEVATDTPVTPPSAPGRGSADVFVTYAEWNADTAAVEAGAYVPGIVEGDGTCTLTLTRDGTSVTGSVPGTPNVDSTACGGLTVPGSDVSSGQWTVVVTYESDRSGGESDRAEVTVP